MSPNKIVFAILGAIILGLIVMLALQLNRGPAVRSGGVSSSGDMSIWIIWESLWDFESYVTAFKKAYPQYENRRIQIESFENRSNYYDVLTASIVTGNAPDIFMLHNTETSPLKNQVLGIDPAKLSPSDFRLRFKPVFARDLIIESEDDSSVEFLSWVPVWYQSLGLIYNRRYFLKPSELETWGKLSFELTDVQKRSNIVPLALWDGTSITQAPLILSNLLVQEGVENIATTSSSDARQAFAKYTNIPAWYDDLALNSPSKTDIEFFTEGSVASMFGTPKDLARIADIGYQSSLLFVSPFPDSESGKSKQAISYEYFVISKDTNHLALAEDFLSYTASSEGQKTYLELFPANLPATTEGELELAEKKIIPKFNVVYKNFLKPEAELVSYRVEDKWAFDLWVRQIWDTRWNYESAFWALKARIVCQTNKYKTFENLSSPCQ